MENAADLNEVMISCYKSTRTFAKVLFPERFHLPFSALHQQIIAILDDPTIQLAAIAAPRGFGKTSLVNLAYPAKKILFREKKFIVPVSCTADQAVLQAENLKRELLTNKEIVSLFGPMKSETFSKETWITSTGTMVMPRGAGQQIRGFLFGRHRPDLIILDDLENSKEVDNEENRKKLKRWLFSDVMNAIDRTIKTWKIIMIGTILHEDSLLANLIEGNLDELPEMAHA